MFINAIPSLFCPFHCCIFHKFLSEFLSEFADLPCIPLTGLVIVKVLCAFEGFIRGFECSSALTWVLGTQVRAEVVLLT